MLRGGPCPQDEWFQRPRAGRLSPVATHRLCRALPVTHTSPRVAWEGRPEPMAPGGGPGGGAVEPLGHSSHPLIIPHSFLSVLALFGVDRFLISVFPSSSLEVAHPVSGLLVAA